MATLTGSPQRAITKVMVGSLEVIDTASIFVAGDDVALSLGGITFRWVFSRTDDTNVSRVRFATTGGEVLIECVNAEGPLPSGMTAPLEVGTYGGRPLLLAFHLTSYRVVESGLWTRQLHVTFYAGKSANEAG